MSELSALCKRLEEENAYLRRALEQATAGRYKVEHGRVWVREADYAVHWGWLPDTDKELAEFLTAAGVPQGDTEQDV